MYFIFKILNILVFFKLIWLFFYLKNYWQLLPHYLHRNLPVLLSLKYVVGQDVKHYPPLGCKYVCKFRSELVGQSVQTLESTEEHDLQLISQF